MSLTPRAMPLAPSSADIYARQRELARNPAPSAFKLRAQLLDRGRTDTPLAASEDMTVRLKVYASGGENTLHAHPHEDHMFLVLDGSAAFEGPDGETVELGANEGIMLPKGSFYRFTATGAKPLVLLRVGGRNDDRPDKPRRIDREGRPMAGDSKENRTETVRFRDGAWFGAP